MSLPGRSGRRGGAGFRWIAAGVVITLLILLIDASVNSRSPGPQETLAADTWIDRALPVIATSNADGQVLASIWAGGLKMPATQVESSFSDLARRSAAAYSTMSALQPPASLEGAAGLLDATLLARSRAAARLLAAIAATLGPGGSTPATAAVADQTTKDRSTTTTTIPTAVAVSQVVPQIVAAGSEIQVGDQAYQLFLSSVPASLKVRMPSSSWGSNATPYTAQAAQVFVTTLQNSVTTSPVSQVKIYGIATSPAPVASSGTIQVLPDSSTLDLNVVVANTGNQPLDNLTVTATISPAGSGGSSVRDFVSLGVGQAYTVNGMGPLNPPQGVPVTLTVTVTSQSAAGLRTTPGTIVFQMPGATPITSPSTTLAPSGATTTVPASGATGSTSSTTIASTSSTT